MNESFTSNSVKYNDKNQLPDSFHSSNDKWFEIVQLSDLLSCYQCEEQYFGNCARGYNLKNSSCQSNDKACFFKSYFDPFNTGHGGKFKYERGCTQCDSEKCLAKETLFRNGLEEYHGTMKTCSSPNCNFVRMSLLEIENPIGAKPVGEFIWKYFFFLN